MANLQSPPPVAWIIGDRLLAEEQWRALVGDNDLVRLDGRRLNLQALAAEVDTLPMFAARKWILVQDFRPPDRTGSDEGQTKASASADQRLMGIIERTGPTCTLILISDTADHRTRIFKAIQKRGQCVELPTFRDYETGKIAAWITERMRSRDKQINQKLATEFVEAVGPEVGILASEVDKLVLAMGDDSVVTDVHMTVVAGNPVCLRRLIDEGIVRRQPGRAQSLLQQTLASNEHPLRILNFIIPRIRSLLLARLCPAGRRNPELATEVFGPMHPFRLKTLYEEAERFSAVELRSAMHSLVLADTCLKSSADSGRVLSLLVAALTGAIDHASFARAVESYVEPWD
jgi:DNA polymerase-3 subunit delta